MSKWRGLKFTVNSISAVSEMFIPETEIQDKLRRLMNKLYWLKSGCDMGVSS